MGDFFRLDIPDGNPSEALRGMLARILDLDEVAAILAPSRLPYGNVVTPVLISDPEALGDCDLLAPSFPLNAAGIVARLTRKPSGGRVAAVLRPCEIRAFVELVKLKQGRMEDLLIIGLDCLGAFVNSDYSRLARDNDELTRDFYRAVLSGESVGRLGADLAPACLVCEYPVPDMADVAVRLIGMNISDHLIVRGRTTRGAGLLSRIDLPAGTLPEGRQSSVDAFIARRIEARDRMFEETAANTDSLEKLSAYFSACVNCHNCRVACPVCYCRECVFKTDVFEHEPIRYLKWSERKGRLKMPTDTVFFHLTRLAHMSTSCVGCGQCSNACPNDIPVMELFRTVSAKTQAAFDYRAGRSLEEAPPLAVFYEDEYPEVTAH